ncbi:hypothetical protein CLV40_11018 [Actinokineospora auranticolor]|uniref:Uncharacterized protein n=1 Tax=Actinokineospora auranticolor TaxID=155976 RepID=A0A2S6GM51_9PSEU|nr:hypothetical protein CLV40_11018 [Actinokineospora auranticolor]
MHTNDPGQHGRGARQGQEVWPPPAAVARRRFDRPGASARSGTPTSTSGPEAKRRSWHTPHGASGPGRSVDHAHRRHNPTVDLVRLADRPARAPSSATPNLLRINEIAAFTSSTSTAASGQPTAPHSGLHPLNTTLEPKTGLTSLRTSAKPRAAAPDRQIAPLWTNRRHGDYSELKSLRAKPVVHSLDQLRPELSVCAGSMDTGGRRRALIIRARWAVGQQQRSPRQTVRPSTTAAIAGPTTGPALTKPGTTHPDPDVHSTTSVAQATEVSTGLIVFAQHCRCPRLEWKPGAGGIPRSARGG